jgi:hypothetical protein
MHDDERHELWERALRGPIDPVEAQALVPRLVKELQEIRYELEHTEHAARRALAKNDLQACRDELAVIRARIQAVLRVRGFTPWGEGEKPADD